MQRDAQENPRRAVQRAQGVAQDAERETGGDDPLQPPARQQPRETEHGDDLGDLAQRHPRGRVGEAEGLQMRRRVGVKRRQRDAEQRRRDEHDAMVVVLEQGERIQAEPLPQGDAAHGRGRLHARQQPGERADRQPHERAVEAGVRRGIGVERADQPAAGHPAHRGHRADGAELTLRVPQPREDDGGGEPPGGRGAERVELDEGEDHPRVPPALNRPGRQRHRGGSGEGQTAQDPHRRGVPVRHRAEEQRRDEGRHRAGGERQRFDRVEAVRVQHGAQGHKPHSHRRSLEKEQRGQFGVFDPRKGAARRWHGRRVGDAPEVCRVSKCAASPARNPDPNPALRGHNPRPERARWLPPNPRR